MSLPPSFARATKASCRKQRSSWRTAAPPCSASRCRRPRSNGRPRWSPRPCRSSSLIRACTRRSADCSMRSRRRRRRKGGAPSLVRFELLLLSELGFGLDLESCAVTDATEKLVAVSPRSGRAVSAAAAEPYQGKLLPLPRIHPRGRAGGLGGHHRRAGAVRPFPAARRPPRRQGFARRPARKAGRALEAGCRLVQSLRR